MLIFQEEDLILKTLTTPEELEAGFRLRHEVFAEELKWVPATEEGLEKDPYDEFSDLMGVFDMGGTILGHVRMTHGTKPFMVEKEFAKLMPPGLGVRKGLDVAEVTRLCVRKEVREKSFMTVSRILYKAVYQWSLMNGVRYLVKVVEKIYYRVLRLTGFPVELLGGFIDMPDGVQAATLILDLRRFEEEGWKKKPEFMEWMSNQQGHYPWQSRLHGLY